jgi:acyl-CoA thioesterase I
MQMSVDDVFICDLSGLFKMKTITQILSVLLYGILLIIPMSVTAQQNTSPNTLHILTLGDSNGTFPYSWPQQLRNLLPNADVYNISKSGRTIGFINLGDTTLNSLLVLDQNLKAAAEHIGDNMYNYIVIDLGTNDAKAIFADKQQVVPENLEKLIHRIQGCEYRSIKNARIIIISPTPYGTKAEATEKYAGGGKRVQEMAETFKAVAQKNDCLFVNGNTIPGLDIDTMTADGLHLDSVAAKKLMEPVVELIKRPN